MTGMRIGRSSERERSGYERRLGAPSRWWLRILQTLERDFGRVPVFLDATGMPRVFVVGSEDRVVVIFATVPEAAVASLLGRRACEAVGHPEFAPGSRNGERVIVEAVLAAAPGEPAAALVLTFGLPLDVTGSRWMDDIVRGNAEPARRASESRPKRRGGL